MSWRLPPLWMVQPVMFNVIVKQDYKNLKRIICILSFYQVVKFHYPLTFFLLIQNIHCWPFCLLLTPTQFSASSCSRPSWHCDRASPQCSGPRTSGFQKTKHRSWTSVITSRPVLHQGKVSAYSTSLTCWWTPCWREPQERSTLSATSRWWHSSLGLGARLDQNLPPSQEFVCQDLCQAIFFGLNVKSCPKCWQKSIKTTTSKRIRFYPATALMFLPLPCRTCQEGRSWK